MIDLYLVFPSRDVAVQVATAISNAELSTDEAGVPVLPTDGMLNGVYYNIAEIGTLHDDNGNALPGYHVNGKWRGTEETIPEALTQFMVHPTTPKVRWG